MMPRATCVVTRPAIMRPSGELIAAPSAASAPPTTSSGLGVLVVPVIGAGSGAFGAMRASSRSRALSGSTAVA